MNNQFVDMYTRRFTKPTVENELIDISSDDSQDKQGKPTNGASTSSNTTDKSKDKPSSKMTSSERGKKRKSEDYGSGPYKKRRSVSQLQEPDVTFKDVGGLDKVLQEVCKLLLHIKHPEVYRQIGISPPRGFLLHGPPGSGKTLLANAIAGVSDDAFNLNC